MQTVRAGGLTQKMKLKTKSRYFTHFIPPCTLLMMSPGVVGFLQSAAFIMKILYFFFFFFFCFFFVQLHIKTHALMRGSYNIPTNKHMRTRRCTHGMMGCCLHAAWPRPSLRARACMRVHGEVSKEGDQGQWGTLEGGGGGGGVGGVPGRNKDQVNNRCNITTRGLAVCFGFSLYVSFL